MVDISPRNTGGPITDDPSWIGSGHGIDSNKTVTLDTSLFTEEDHFPDGFIPSGTPLAMVTATGLYGPYDPGDDPVGLGTLDCFLYSPLTVEYTGQKLTGAGYAHGPVIEANLPESALDSNGKADVANRIWFE